jgi:hypothetical protein
MELTAPYHRSELKRTLTADNYFSSIALAEQLIANKFSFVGTLRKNKTEIPWQLQPYKTRPINSSIFGFLDEKTLVSYVPKINKAVILISTEHHTNATNQQENNKPEIIEFYNRTKGILVFYY